MNKVKKECCWHAMVMYHFNRLLRDFFLLRFSEYFGIPYFSNIHLLLVKYVKNHLEMNHYTFFTHRPTAIIMVLSYFYNMSHTTFTSTELVDLFEVSAGNVFPVR